VRGIWRSFLSIVFVTGAVLPAFAAECGPLNLITSMDMITVSGGRPGIAAKIMDKPVTLLVDTGGAFSMVSRSVVRELKLPVGQAQIEIVNVAGQRSREQVRLPSITLGTLRQEGAYFMVDPADAPSGERSFQGVIAPDFLSRVDADFDFGAKKLNLVSPNHCEGKVVYWSAPASAPALAVVAFRIDRSGHISFPVRLDERRVNAILDTGAYNTALNLDIARRTFNVDTNAPDVEKVGQVEGSFKADIFRKQFKTLAIEGVTVNNPTIDLLPDLMTAPGGTPTSTGSLIRDSDNNLPGIILGMNVLSRLHVYIAYKEAKLYITAAAVQPAASPAAAPSP
jgi:predicted aspartyl protease